MCYYKKVLTVLEYLDLAGKSPFRAWFDGLNREAAAKVTSALVRIEQGNLANVKGVTGGLHEYRIDFGPGYRIYFGKDGIEIVILLGGGSKKKQVKDIAIAAARWQDYKVRKKRGEK